MSHGFHGVMARFFSAGHCLIDVPQIGGSPTEGHPGCFQVSVIVDKAAV